MMASREILELASEFGVSRTLPELEQDIDAQLEALYDPDHPKRAVFLARENHLADRKIPRGITVEQRPEGTLITNSIQIALIYRALEIVTDADLAAILGYPETKADVMRAGHGNVVQALDSRDRVIFEAAASPIGLDATICAAIEQMPEGGRIHIDTIEHALARRLKRMN